MRGQPSVFRFTASLLLTALLLSPNVSFSAQPVTKGKAPATRKAATQKPFVIQETYRQETGRERQPYENERGIVGLDMLIEPNHYPVVQRIFKGTPAYAQGVKMGDTILAINGVRAINKSLWEVDRLISDVPGEVVSLIILREGKRRQVSLTVMPISEANVAVRSSFAGLMP